MRLSRTIRTRALYSPSPQWPNRPANQLRTRVPGSSRADRRRTKPHRRRSQARCAGLPDSWPKCLAQNQVLHRPPLGSSRPPLPLLARRRSSPRSRHQRGPARLSRHNNDGSPRRHRRSSPTASPRPSRPTHRTFRKMMFTRTSCSTSCARAWTGHRTFGTTPRRSGNWKRFYAVPARPVLPKCLWKTCAQPRCS